MCVHIYPDLLVASEVRLRLKGLRYQCQLKCTDNPTNQFFKFINLGIYISVEKLIKDQTSFLTLDLSKPIFGNEEDKDYRFGRRNFEVYFQSLPTIFSLTDSINGIYRVEIGNFFSSHPNLSVDKFTQKFCTNLLTQGDYDYTVLKKVGLG